MSRPTSPNAWRSPRSWARAREAWRALALRTGIARAGQPTLRLIVSADAVNADDTIPAIYVMQVVGTDPGSLLAVRIGDHGWAFALRIERPPRKRLTECVGAATAAEMEQVETALRATFEL